MKVLQKLLRFSFFFFISFSFTDTDNSRGNWGRKQQSLFLPSTSNWKGYQNGTISEKNLYVNTYLCIICFKKEIFLEHISVSRYLLSITNAFIQINSITPKNTFATEIFQGTLQQRRNTYNRAVPYTFF